MCVCVREGSGVELSLVNNVELGGMCIYMYDVWGGG